MNLSMNVNMKKLRTLGAALPLLAALGCDGGGGEEPDLLPSASLDPRPSSISLRLTSQQLPCGFDWQSDPADGYDVSSLHTLITYDDLGRAVRQENTDDTGALYGDETYEYEGGPDWVHAMWTNVERDPFQMWQTFDSFGRKVRYSGDSDGDGDEDWVATYENDDQGRRVFSHFEDTFLDPPWIHERDYRYDDTGRLVAIDRDDGLDGTIDQTVRIAYDDVAGTVTQTEVDAFFGLASVEELEYGDDNRLDARHAETTYDEGGATQDGRTYAYDGEGRMIEEVYVFADGTFGRTETTSYRYDGCN